MDKRTIWLTGCTSGLGRALVEEFTSTGHTVAGFGRSKDSIEKLNNRFPAPHFFATADASDDTQVKKFCANAFEQTGAPDLLINNAAIINRNATLWNITAKEFDQLTAININGTANMIRNAVPMMIKNNCGIIVNLSSGWGRSTSPEVAPYCASKWAIEGLSQALAQELPDGLATVAMNPGMINTPMLQQCWGEHANSYDDAATWAKTAAPFLLSITPAQNGEPLTAP